MKRGHFEYKVRPQRGDCDCGGEYGFVSREAAIAGFKKSYPNWRELHCDIYAHSYRGCSYKDAGNARFVHYADPVTAKRLRLKS